LARPVRRNLTQPILRARPPAGATKNKHAIQAFRITAAGRGRVEQWGALRHKIHAEICQKSFNSELNAFVQSYGSKELDASLLLLPLVGFLPADDPRIQGTVTAIEKGLLKDSLVARYDTTTSVDGLVGGEGVFLACSFWLADN